MRRIKVKEPIKVKITNINKHGEIFDPATYTVSREENPELYEFLENFQPHEKTAEE